MNRLDCKVNTQSKWRLIYTVSFLSLTLLIAMIIGIAWWLIAVLAILTVIVYLFTSNPKQQVLHITSANEDDHKGYWQLLITGRADNELWEMILVEANCYNKVIQLKFNVVHPMVLDKTVILWQDQVDSESWRKLRVISRW